MARKDEYTRRLARTVDKLFKKRTYDPSASEIGHAHFSGEVLGGEIIDGIQKRLLRIKRLLEKEYDRPVYLVNDRYYDQFRENKPTTKEEAQKCVPWGRTRRAAGIALSVRKSDIIYEASLEHNISIGAGRVKKGIDRTLEAVMDKRLEPANAALLLDQTQEKMRPTKKGLAKRVMKKLPDKT